MSARIFHCVCASLLLVVSWTTARADLQAKMETNRRYVPPPGSFRADAGRKVALITVNWNGACPAGVTEPWPPQAQEAFLYAVEIWASILNASRPIVIDACWRTDLSAGVLGNAQATAYWRDFTGAPIAGTWYPVPLANQLADSDLNGAGSEITANFNADSDWYFGTDGNTGANQFDFVTVVLHEIGHGVGIAGSMRVDDGVAPNECNGTAGAGCWGAGSTWPRIYDRFTERGDGTAMLSIPNNSAEMTTALTTGVWFDGPGSSAVFGDRVPLHAPGTFAVSSSYSHLSDTFNSTENSLMTWSLSMGEAVHHPGPVVIAMLADEGWDMRWLGTVYVSSAHVGLEDGTLALPFNTVQEGVLAVHDGGLVYVLPGMYGELLHIARPMRIEALSQPVTIGQ